ncbi:hypothetical protein BC938DRAFT_480067 [Jimgerdemannia flammicorona]|uniref:PROP1-like PPR domain-containing protein n=1 Tax=Jimgerdemannia flammicorona TaxID=994334 RepID=A0A433QJG8_9FUNG|nr:hypothetical protein BC938DRAFT_480067 [Jimgerdemannia flammicorona]
MFSEAACIDHLTRNPTVAAKAAESARRLRSSARHRSQQALPSTITPTTGDVLRASFSAAKHAGSILTFLIPAASTVTSAKVSGRTINTWLSLVQLNGARWATRGVWTAYEFGSAGGSKLVSPSAPGRRNFGHSVAWTLNNDSRRTTLQKTRVQLHVCSSRRTLPLIMNAQPLSTPHHSVLTTLHPITTTVSTLRCYTSVVHPPSGPDTPNIFHAAALEQSTTFAAHTPIRALLRGISLKRNPWPPDRAWDCYTDLALHDLLSAVTREDYHALIRYFIQIGNTDNNYGIVYIQALLMDMRAMGMSLGRRERLALMHVLGLNGRFGEMERVFEGLERDGLLIVGDEDQRPFRTLMVTYGEREGIGMIEKVLEVYERMRKRGIVPDNQTYNAFKSVLRDLGEPDIVWKWFTGLTVEETVEEKAERMREGKDGAGGRVTVDSRLYRELLMYFAGARKVEYALELWDAIAARGIERSVYEYTEMIHKAGRAGYVSRALEIFDEMMKQHGPNFPTTATFSALIDIHAHAKPHPDVDAALQAYEHMLALNIHPDVRTYSPLLDMFAKRGDLVIVRRLYADLLTNGIPPNVYIFSSLIECLVGHEDIQGATAIFRAMPALGVNPNEVTYNLLIRTYAREQDLQGAWRLLEAMIAADVRPDVVTFSTLIALHADLCDVSGARAVARRMISTRVRPNQYVYAALMDAYARAGDVIGAERIFEEMFKTGWKPNKVVYNTLLGTYVRAGDMSRVLLVYRRMEKDPTIGFNAYTFAHLIEGFTRRGAMRAAEELLSSMPGVGIRPNMQCFTALMQGYVWRGELEGAQDVVKRMIGEGIRPGFRTYAVLVDAYARAGELDTAARLVERVGIEAAEAARNAVVEEEIAEVERERERRRMQARSWTWMWGEEEVAEVKGEAAKTTATAETIEEILTRTYLHSPRTSVPPPHVFQPLLEAYVRMGMGAEARELLAGMCGLGVRLSSQVFVTLMNLYRREGNVAAVEAIWEALSGPTSGIVDDPSTTTKATLETDTIPIPDDPVLEGLVPHPTILRPYYRPPAPPPNFALSVLVDTLSVAGRMRALDRLWKRLETMGYQFDVHNWNRLAVAMVRGGHVIEACQIASEKLLREPSVPVGKTPVPESLAWELSDEDAKLMPEWLLAGEAEKKRTRGSERRRDRIGSDTPVYPPFPHQRTMTALAMCLERLRVGNWPDKWDFRGIGWSETNPDESGYEKAAKTMEEIEARFPDVMEAIGQGELVEFTRELRHNLVDEDLEAQWREWESEEWEEGGWGKQRGAMRVFLRWRRDTGMGRRKKDEGKKTARKG